MKRFPFSHRFSRLLVLVISTVFFVQDARSQDANPVDYAAAFMFYGADAKGKMIKDAQGNPSVGMGTRVVNKSRWIPANKGWEDVNPIQKDRYTKKGSVNGKKVENFLLPEGVKDFPFSHTYNAGGGVNVTRDISKFECTWAWQLAYLYDEWDRGSPVIRNLVSVPAGQFNTSASFDWNCYGYATGYNYWVLTDGFPVIMQDDGWTEDGKLICKAKAIGKFAGDHVFWIGGCCPSDCGGLETIYWTRERNATSPTFEFVWTCDKMKGGGNLRDNVHKVYGKASLFIMPQ